MPVPYSHSQPDPQNGWKGLPASSTAPDGGNGPGQTSSYPLKANTEWSIWGPVDRVEHFFGSVYDRTLEAAHDLKEKERRIEDIAKAAWRADSVYCDAAVRKRIGMEFDELKKGFLSGLLYCLAIVAATTFLGATLGGLLGGMLTVGTAAIPAAIGGGELGFDAGMLLLDAIGIGFLLKKIYNEIPKVFELIKHGVNTAWNAGSNRGHSAEQDIDAAARELADAEAELVAIILQGILLWILSESSVSKAGKIGGAIRQTARDMGALNTPATLAARGEELMQSLKDAPAAARAALDAATAELVTTLRKGGRLTEGLADFIEKRKEQILKSATEDLKKQIPKPKSDSGGAPDEQANVVKDKTAQKPKTYKPGRQNVDLKDVRYSQGNVSPKTSAGVPIKDVAADMKANGWDTTKPAPDMVTWGTEEDGVTTLDHRRLVAADQAGLDEVPANVHDADEPMDPDAAKRFTLRPNADFTDPDTGVSYTAGDQPSTWGEAAKFRSANQTTMGYPDFPLKGSPTLPDIKGGGN